MIAADFSETLVGVGFQFFDADGPIGARQTAGITTPRPGLYVAAAVTPPANAVGVYWDNGDGTKNASEFFDARLAKLDVAGVLAHTGNADTFKATGFALETTLAALALRASEARLGKLDVSGVLAHTDNAATFKATGFATAADWTAARAAKIDALDAPVSSRLASASYTAPTAAPSADTIADAVWNEQRAGHTSPGAFGYFLDAQVSTMTGGGGGGATPAQIWDYLTGSAVTPGSLGKLIADNLNATISSRLASVSYTAPPSAADWTTARAAKIDTLETTVAALALRASEARLGKLAVSGVLAHTDNAATFRATGFATAADVLPAITAAEAANAKLTPERLARIDGAQQSAAPVMLPTPAPEGYGLAGSLEISGLTPEQSGQLAFVAEKAAQITSGRITLTSPVIEGGKGLILIRGNDYRARDGREIDFTRDTWADLTGATVVLHIGTFSTEAAILAARVIRFELTREQTASIAAGHYSHRIDATLANGDVLTLIRGFASVGDA